METYQDVIREIESIPHPKQIIGVVEELPIYKVTAGNGPKHILLSGGIHGDEIAGPHAVIKFLKTRAHLHKGFTFHAYPCINPTAYNKQRDNSRGQNINRKFYRGTDCQEAEIVIPTLGRYRAGLDFHESGWSKDQTNTFYVEKKYRKLTWEEVNRYNATPTHFDREGRPTQYKDPAIFRVPHEFYIYESCPDKSLRIGHRIISNMQVPICTWDVIADEMNRDGVVWYPEACTNEEYVELTSFESFLNLHHTEQSFTLETPLQWPLEMRVQAHIAALETALGLFS
ncbi:succinylglutamate desuccinylase/aspartoacylase family protein [Candidatus Woesearchaeota archaeon]|nr:succinylglutamate desuccinylase/aspartoacylase family protein [Candidatus Woesearchaeota archaeon]